MYHQNVKEHVNAPCLGNKVPASAGAIPVSILSVLCLTPFMIRFWSAI